MSKPQTHLLGLHNVAEEIGISPATVLRHPHDFFKAVRLGGKHYVSAKAYADWLKRTYASVGVDDDSRQA